MPANQPSELLVAMPVYNEQASVRKVAYRDIRAMLHGGGSP